MATASPNNSTEIAQFAGALYDVALGNPDMQSVLSAANTQGLDPFLNAFYSAQFGSTATASVAQTVAQNLGLSGSALSLAETYITDQLNATTPDNRGAIVASVLDQFAALTGNATFGPAAQAWDGLINDAVTYSQSAASASNVALSSLPGLSLNAPYTLTAGTDHIVAAYNNAVIDGFGQGLGTASSGVTPTFTTGDTLSGGTTTGATLNLTDTETGGIWNPTAVPQATVSNIPHVNLYSGEVVVFAPTNSVMGYTGLSDVHITSVSGGYQADDVVVGPNTAVTISDQAGAGLGPSPYGSYGTIVQGGSQITVTEANGSGYGNAHHAILINGGSGTTQVSITQTESQPKGYQQGVAIVDNSGTIRTISVSGLDNTSWTAVVNYGSSYGYGYGGYSALKQFNGGDLKITNAAALTQLTVGNMVNGAYANVNGANVLTNLTVDNVTGNAYINLYNPLAQPMALNLSLQGINGAVELYDEASVYTTLNVSVAGNAALDYMVATSFTSDHLQNLNVSGTGVLSYAQTLQTPANLARVSVQGSAGLNADLSSAGSGSTVIDASQSSGAVTVWVDGTQQQVFLGGTGPTVVYLDGNASDSLTAGSGSSNEVVLNFALGGTPLTPQSESQIKGFDILGVTSALGAGSLSINVAAFSGDPIHTLDVQSGGASGSLTFSGVAAGSTLQVDAGDPQALIVQTADLQGPTDSLSVTLGQAGATGNATTTALTLQDSLLQGIGNVTLNTPGSVGFSQTLDAFTDLALGSLTLSGTQSVLISTLTDQATALAVTDLAAGTSAIQSLNDANLATLTLTGNLALTLTNDAVTSGVTINAGQDSGTVAVSLTSGAAAGATDQITLGDGNNTVIDPSASGHLSITVGSGANQIVLAGSGIQGSITLGVHAATTSDQISLGAVGLSGNQAQVLVTGFSPGNDQIHFLADPLAANSVITISPTAAATYAMAHGLDLTQLSTWVDGALASNGLNLASHAVASFQFNGNTYLLEQAGATGSAFTSGDTLVGLTGLLTITHL
ncbi:MAG: hypothetical protein KGI47_06850 [Betaproteobacteria bacterium]|nr:hypothetical protein [Betaproteobacteria bacterium]